MKKFLFLFFLVFVLVIISCTVISRNDGQTGGESAASLITVTEAK